MGSAERNARAHAPHFPPEVPVADAAAPATSDRIRERRAQRAKEEKPAEAPFTPRTALVYARGIADAMVLAYVLAMFIRTFVFELFMIPTGSMTPTLIGDQARKVVLQDYDGDGVGDVVTTESAANRAMVYLMGADGVPKDVLVVEGLPGMRMRTADGQEGFTTYERFLQSQSIGRTDFILVNKFAYWFSPPDRGDIAVFKVPDRPGPMREPADEFVGPSYPRSGFDRYKPIYIKRVIGLPGEEITLQPVQDRTVRKGEPGYLGKWEGPDIRERHIDGQPVLVDGKPLDPTSVEGRIPHYPPPNSSIYPVPGVLPWRWKAADDEVFMFGDHQSSSQDSRYWGGVPTSHLRGRAVIRYWPVQETKMLK